MILDWKSGYYRYHRYFVDLQQKVVSPQFRSFTWLSVTIFTVSFFMLTAIRPTIVTIVRLQREITEKQNANEKLQIKIDSLIAAQNEMVNYLDKIDLLYQAIPEKNNYSLTSRQFEDLAAANDLVIKSLTLENSDTAYNISNKTGKGKFEAINFGIGVIGSYEGLKTFLISVENSKRLMLIESIRFFTSIKETGSELGLTIQGKILSGGSFFVNTTPVKKNNTNNNTDLIQ